MYSHSDMSMNCKTKKLKRLIIAEKCCYRVSVVFLEKKLLSHFLSHKMY